MKPLKFKPLLKQTLWGGNRIKEIKGIANERHGTRSNVRVQLDFDEVKGIANERYGTRSNVRVQPDLDEVKGIDTDMDDIGESWEISGVKGNETIVADGPYSGTPLNTLVATLKGDLVGKENYKRYGDEFPLLIKFIDARQDLSIQVHPSDEIAKRQGKDRGKTEMWYILDSDNDAKLYNGLKKAITPEEYKTMVADDTITEALAQYSVREGDVFFIPAGRIHAIGRGCFVAEIQQTSDVTYRIYDFKRKDKNGKYRQLHTDEAAECIDYSVKEDYRTYYDMTAGSNEVVVDCPYFTTSVCNVKGSCHINTADTDSFVILIATRGEAVLIDSFGNTTPLRAGETILFPAVCSHIDVMGDITLLQTSSLHP